MAGNIVPFSPHATFEQKVSNFPDSLYFFNEGDNLTTLMKILLGNSGTGQLYNVQTAARLGQQHIEFQNLDNILGMILNIRRISPEIYSFATNPFIDQLTDNQWQEIIYKDASYRERLIGAAESFQTGATIWSVLTLCEAMTQMKFYVTESWRNSTASPRAGMPSQYEVVLIPLNSSNSFWTWDQSKANAILQAINKIVPAQFVVTFGTPINNFTQISGSYISTSGGYSEYFHLGTVVNTSQMSTPSLIAPGANTRYWVQNNSNNVAPFFAHLQTQEISIDLTGNVVSATVSGSVGGVPSNSVAQPSLQVTSTVYGAV